MQPHDLARQAAGAPPEPLGTRASTTGVVKRWRDDKGHGVIAAAATAPWDIWCHFSAVDTPGFKALAPGQRVHVEYVRADQESFRYVAQRAKPLDAEGEAAEPSPLSGRDDR